MALASRIRGALGQLQRDWREAQAKYPQLLRALGAVFVLASVVSLAGGVWFLSSLRRGLPNEAEINRIGDMDQATTVYDERDHPAFTIYKEQRIDVPLVKMSPQLVQALIATEDQRFYDHHGFDPIRMLSAALADIRHARATQGASTITQQLARQSFLKPDK